MHKLPLALPPWKTLGRKLESMVRKALFDFAMLDDHPKKIALALSGGKDSLTLLFLLKALSGKGFPPFEITAIHVSGEFSCGASLQQNYLKSICEALSVTFITKTSPYKREKLECYSCSRERRRLLFEAAREHDIQTIAFGHHRDDNAQTILMNLLHKAEFAGMLPKLKMTRYNVTTIRPLIYVSEDEIRQFAKEYGFSRVTCQCPVGSQSMRKKVDELLADIEHLFPHARSNISQGGLLYGSHKAEG